MAMCLLSKKNETKGTCCSLKLTKSKSFLNLSIPPCLLQFHRKYKKNSILIENKYTFVSLRVIEIFIKI